MKFLMILMVMGFCSCSTRTIYIVRHGEKMSVPANADRKTASDPALSKEGEERAVELARMMKDKGIRYVFSTDYKRTKGTLTPLSEALGIPIEVYPAAPDSLAWLQAKIERLPRGNVIIAGHSNTIDDIANRFAGKKVVAGDLPETTFDNLYIIKKKGKNLKFVGKKYGTSTP